MKTSDPRTLALAPFAGILALATGAGCPRELAAPPPEPPDARLAEREVRDLSRADIRRASRRADRGVVAGADDGASAALVPLVPPPGRAIAMPPLWAGADGESPPTVSARPPEPGLRILDLGPGDEPPDPAYRAAAWGGLAHASRALGAELGKLAFSVQDPGAPPADVEAALAGGFAASAGAGLELREGAVALGISGPDGTLLATPEVPGLAAEARERGALEVGVPAAAADEADAESLETAHDAIALMTGEALPEPAPLPGPAMALSEAEHALALEAYGELREAIGARWGELVRLRDQAPLPRALDDLVALARRDARLAEDAAHRNELGGALARAERALVATDAATAAWRLVEAIRERAPEDAEAEVLAYRDPLARARAAAGVRIEAGASARAATTRAASAAVATRALAAAESARAPAHRARRYAQEAVALPEGDRRSLEVARGAVRAALPALVGAARSSALLWRADLLASASGEIAGSAVEGDALSDDEPPDTARLERLAAAFAAMGDAKRRAGEAAAGGDSRPLGARAALRGAELSRRAGGALGPATAAYAEGWIYAAKARALGPRWHMETGGIAGFDHAAPRQVELASAERRARSLARWASAAAGHIPTGAKLAYAAGRELEGGGDDERARALAAFWRASVAAELAIAVALR